jgi:hypothetical protein
VEGRRPTARGTGHAGRPPACMGAPAAWLAIAPCKVRAASLSSCALVGWRSAGLRAAGCGSSAGAGSPGGPPGSPAAPWSTRPPSAARPRSPGRGAACQAGPASTLSTARRLAAAAHFQRCELPGPAVTLHVGGCDRLHPSSSTWHLYPINGCLPRRPGPQHPRAPNEGAVAGADGVQHRRAVAAHHRAALHLMDPAHHTVRAPQVGTGAHSRQAPAAAGPGGCGL